MASAWQTAIPRNDDASVRLDDVSLDGPKPIRILRAVARTAPTGSEIAVIDQCRPTRQIASQTLYRHGPLELVGAVLATARKILIARSASNS